MKYYAIKIGVEVLKVKGIVNSKEWLEWKEGENSGIAQPGTFCIWKERKNFFPGCKESTQD